jgi:hypothetical protein
MKKSIVLLLVTVALLMVFPQQTNAQSLKNDSIAYDAKSVATQYLSGMVSGDVKKMLSYDIDYARSNAEERQQMEESFKEYVSHFKGATFTVGNPKYEEENIPVGHPKYELATKLRQKFGSDRWYNDYIDVVITLSNGEKIAASLNFYRWNGKWYIQSGS